ncbi:HAMP domain-containing sensor histidine kinase [Streptomyces niveiscabiei]|uniref:HAMP domain-containing sensor histidine kinase n=1 Tax=Streptomyces niveiscabiei TaxID=164115 RepID=UPI0029BC717C|nr:HAMP domain-containing sensor histidine kinase [Streptomyces niveiscabiei]MDX3382478.1 HAMP domain-containing sensor histidine kinase [Streptomyces niveiscabiei]
MRRPGTSLGTKVALAVAAAATCVASAVGVLVHHLTAEDQLKTARAAFDRDMVTAAYDHASGRRTAARLDRPGLPAPVAHAVRNKVRVTYLHDGVLWAATPVAGGKVLSLRRSYRPEEKALATLDRTLLATGAAATVAVSLAGLLLGMRVGRRATAAARTAERIAEGDLDARVHPRGHDEIARLAAAVNTMADALGARLEAERRVTADIAHELRTPVAGMSTAVGLLPPGRPSELIADSVGKLRGLVEDVLEVARMDAQVAAVDKEQREVSAMARRAVSGLAGVSVDVVADAVVATDPRRVERILANLAANALRHGRAPVVMTVEGAVIRVRDQGAGFPADLLAILHASGPQRFRTGARTGGTGLGLTIATGQARLLGAQLAFRNHPGGGAEAELRLPVGE